MMATDFVYPLLSPIAQFIVYISIVLLGFALLHMIGKTH